MRSLLEPKPVAQVAAAGAAAEPARSKAAPGSLPFFKRPAMVQLHAPSQELQDLKDRYIAWMVATRYADLTVKSGHVSIEWLFKFLSEREITRIADVTAEVLNDYSLWLREQPSTYHEGKFVGTRTLIYKLSGLRMFFRWLTENMVILCDPAQDLEIPVLRPALPQIILTQAEVKKLLDSPDLRSPVGYRDKALLELVYATGIRTAELLKLKVSDLDLKERTVFIREGKGGKDRIVPIPALAAGYIKEYVEKVRPKFAKRTKGKDDGTVFLGWLGARTNKGALTETFKRTRRLAGIEKPITAMVLRHSIASHLLENGMDIRLIQDFLGHERLKTTTIYAKVTLSGLRKHYNKHHPKEKRVRGALNG